MLDFLLDPLTSKILVVPSVGLLPPKQPQVAQALIESGLNWHFIRECMGIHKTPGGGGGVLRNISDKGCAKPFFGFEICDLRTFLGFEIL